MKQITLASLIILFSLCSYAGSNSSLLKLSTAWKPQTHSQLNTESYKKIVIVYGGADITRKPTIAVHTTTT